MLISPTSLELNSAVSAPGSSSTGAHSVRAFPLPASLPLSTLLPPPPDHLSTRPPSDTQSLPDPRSAHSPFPSMMSSGVDGLGLPTSIGITEPQSKSTPSLPSTSLHPVTTTTPGTGTSLRSSSALTSNSIASAALPSLPTSGISIAIYSTSPLSTSGTTPLGLSSPSISSLSMTAGSMPGFTFTFTFTPTSIVPLATDSTTQPLPSSTSESSVTPETSPSIRLPSTSFAVSSTPRPSSTFGTTTVLIPTTVDTTVTPSSVPMQSPWTSTYTMTSVLLSNDGGTVTDFVTSSGVLSTQTPGVVGSNVHPSSGMIVGLVLGIVGTIAFAALWLFCARRRHRKLVQEAAFSTPQMHASPPLGDEVPDAEELAYGSSRIYGTAIAPTRSGPPMEERYAGILAALHSTEGFGKAHATGSTGGVYGSHRDSYIDGDDDIARGSSPTLPIYKMPPDDLLYAFALSPPPPVPLPSRHQVVQPVPPPTAYTTSRRKSSPGPDAATWLTGHSVAPSCASQYARSQTLGSGSASGSVDALTRTRTGSEEPLLSIRKPSVELLQVPSDGGISPTTTTTITDRDLGGNRPGLGSAFGSPEGSLYSPSAVSHALYRDLSGSYDARSTFGSGSYGHTRSGTPSSFDVLRSVSSQGALSSAYNHGHGPSQGFKFGFSKSGSTSSGSTGQGKKRGGSRQSFGVPPTSFTRAWRDWGSGSATSDKEKLGGKQSFGERDWRRRTGSATSGSSSGSIDEKQEKSSPVLGVRALLDRLRRAGHTPSPRSSNRDLPSPTLRNSTDVDPEKAIGKMSVERVTPPPPPIHVQVATPQHRRQYSFILSNPDPHPPSPHSGIGDVAPPSSDVPLHQELLPNPHDIPFPHPHDLPPSVGELHPRTSLPIEYVPVMTAPSPAPTEESRLVEGLLHPRLRNQGCSDSSLMDFEDYSRPIGGVVKNRMYSTTTFGTQDDTETTSPSGGTPVQELQEAEIDEDDVFGASTMRTPRESWFVDDGRHGSARNSPIAV